MIAEYFKQYSGGQLKNLSGGIYVTLQPELAYSVTVCEGRLKSIVTVIVKGVSCCWGKNDKSMCKWYVQGNSKQMQPSSFKCIP